MYCSGIKKRSIVLAGHKTSVSLEDEFWEGLRQIADERGKSLSGLLAEIDTERTFENLSSALRLFVLRYYRGPPDQQGGMVAPLDLDPSNPVGTYRAGSCRLLPQKR
jgi:predicted DNA-binding ribbon-helix-helix protein